jgi:hypothetical protein
MIQNLKNLYVPVDSRKNTIAEGAPEFNKDRAKEDAKEADECDRRVRYVTKVDRAVQQLLEGKLSKDKFPYVNREGKVDDDEEPDDDGCAFMGFLLRRFVPPLILFFRGYDGVCV